VFFGQSLAILAQFTLEMCVAARNREKFNKTLYFGRSKSSKIIDVDIRNSLSACYEKCLCLSANIFMLNKPLAVKWRLLGGVPLFHPLVRGIVRTLWPSDIKLCHEILETLGYHMVKNWKSEVSISLVLGSVSGRDRQDRQTDRQTELP